MRLGCGRSCSPPSLCRIALANVEAHQLLLEPSSHFIPRRFGFRLGTTWAHAELIFVAVVRAVRVVIALDGVTNQLSVERTLVLTEVKALLIRSDSLGK